MGDPGYLYDRLAQIVGDRACLEIDGVLVDMQSANAILTVYDALSPANRVKFINRSIGEMGELAWTLIDKARKR
jgi:hypothetical protein